MATIVCINGDLGSGKSSAIGKLSERLHWKVFSTGAAQRQLAREMGITTLELNRISETDRSIDDKIDSVFADLAQSEEDLIVDSRMAWHFLPMGKKVRLVCHPSTSGRRVYYDTDRSAETYETIEAATADIQVRRASEKSRFKAFYDVDVEHLPNYDAIIQTDLHSLSDVVEKIQAIIESEPQDTVLNLSPRLIFPTVSEPAEGSPSNDGTGIEVVYVRDCFFVVRGHEQLSAAVRGEQPWIEARLRSDETAAAKVAGGIDSGVISEWQTALGFEFPFLPDLD
ncbi:MAG: AAA family ATPase [Pseudomonadota bacterium]